VLQRNRPDLLTMHCWPDWGLYRGGAIFVEGAENITIQHNVLTRLDGNGVFVSGYTRHVQISDNEFSWIGCNSFPQKHRHFIRPDLPLADLPLICWQLQPDGELGLHKRKRRDRRTAAQVHLRTAELRARVGPLRKTKLNVEQQQSLPCPSRGERGV
jgi:hypothetical protein